MRRVCVIMALLMGMWESTAGAQEPAGNPLLEKVKPSEPGTRTAELSTLKICLRLDDETPFLGAALVRVLPEAGFELLGARDETKGDVVFYAVASGKYLIDVEAAGFRPVQLKVQMEAGGREKALFVVMQRRTSTTQETKAQAIAPVTAPAEAKTETTVEPLTTTPLEIKTETALHSGTTTSSEESKETLAEVKAAIIERPVTKKEAWKPPEWSDEFPVDHGVACPREQVLHAAGERVREFIGSMEKFTATESVEHYAVDKAGARKGPARRSFAYVVMVARDRMGTFSLDEFRNGSTDPRQFPASIATMGLPAIVLVFHPDYENDFEFQCDGLVRREGREYWQMRFAQRVDRPVRIESYVVNGSAFPVHLEGRAWIDPGKGQVVRLESRLQQPIPQIELWEQHQKIDYTGVKFASTGQEVWLPQAAEVYVERHGKRYYRRHTFEDFRLFNVDTAQNVKAPKGSYSFTNLTDSDMSGELTVMPADGLKGGPITLRFDVPARKTVIKAVGPGKDVNLPVAAVGSAKFVHSGNAGAVKVDVDLVKETTLDVIPEAALANP